MDCVNSSGESHPPLFLFLLLDFQSEKRQAFLKVDVH
jgi:hypothetical protein